MNVKSATKISLPSVLQQQFAANIEAVTRQHLTYIKQHPDIDSTVDIYQSLLFLLEEPLFKVTLEESKNNQSLAARWLGISRATLRSKLNFHCLDVSRQKQNKD